MFAKERIFLTETQDRAVVENDPNAAFLYAAQGHKIPIEAAEKFKIVDGLVTGKRAEKQREENEKNRRGGEDKSRKGGEDKSRNGGEKKPNSENGGGALTGEAALIQIKGIGAASAATLIASGFDTVEKLAAIDPENPPQVEGLTAGFKWAEIITSARELQAA